MQYGYGCGVDPCYHGGYTSPVGYGCAYPAVGGVGHHCGFALIVVLFILLIIIGASYYCK